MNNCPKCNEQVQPDDLFCGQCGFRLFAHHKKGSVTQHELKVNDIRFNLGIVYLKKKAYDRAIEVFSKILEEKPNSEKVIEMIRLAENEDKKMKASGENG